MPTPYHLTLAIQDQVHAELKAAVARGDVDAVGRLLEEGLRLGRLLNVLRAA